MEEFFAKIRNKSRIFIRTEAEGEGPNPNFLSYIVKYTWWGL